MKLSRIALLAVAGSLALPLAAEQQYTPMQMAARRLQSDLEASLPGTSLTQSQKTGMLDEVKVLMNLAGLQGNGKRPDLTAIKAAESDLDKSFSSGKFKLRTEGQLQVDLENFKAAAE